MQIKNEIKNGNLHWHTSTVPNRTENYWFFGREENRRTRPGKTFGAKTRTAKKILWKALLTSPLWQISPESEEHGTDDKRNRYKRIDICWPLSILWKGHRIALGQKKWHRSRLRCIHDWKCCQQTIKRPQCYISHTLMGLTTVLFY